MRLTKGQLKRIIREEYSRLKRRGLIKESGPYHGNDPYEDVYMGNPEEQQQFVVNDTADILNLLKKQKRKTPPVPVEADKLQEDNEEVDVYGMIDYLQHERGLVYLDDDGILHLL